MSQPAPWVDEGAALGRAILAAGAGWTSFPVPVGRGRALAGWALGHEGGFTWERTGESLIGAGIALAVEASGERRFAEVQARIAGLAPTLPAEAVLVGGFAFAAGRTWPGFADASFVLPRFTYRDDGTRAWLAIANLPDNEPISPRDASALVAVLLAGDLPAAAPPSVRGVSEESEAAWNARVERALEAIASGQLTKVVCARRASVRFHGVPEVAGILARLPAGADVTRFAVRRGERIFFGATPERLVARAGTEVRIDALAGSAVRGEGLMDSAKDRHEQRLVVDDIATRIAPLCAVVEAPSVPRPRAAPGVTHLHTAITARTRGNVPVLALAGVLHPTPAVGGVPTAAAVELIAAHEPNRGWYAGGVGWSAVGGDGELAVAIRSALLCRDEATLFAGGGIVRGSDARAELRETGWKLAPMLAALGAM
jgi:salicylate biosynthesis isochorismate synthase